MGRAKCIPSEEGGEREGGVEGDVGVGAGGGADLAATAETVEGVEETGTHEADEAEHEDLDDGIVVERLHAGVPLVDGGVELDIAAGPAGEVLLVGMARVGHGSRGRERAGVRGDWMGAAMGRVEIDIMAHDTDGRQKRRSTISSLTLRMA